ncbi:MAG: hypothetical protein NTW80_11875, partial [Deltaproteobacteria bacterium]|nr:hypothetical protein [Deltaproteobacteria bacterium]
ALFQAASSPLQSSWQYSRPGGIIPEPSSQFTSLEPGWGTPSDAISFAGFLSLIFLQPVTENFFTHKCAIIPKAN